MFKLILLVLLNLLGFEINQKPVRLSPKNTWSEKKERWVETHQHELRLLIIFVMMVMFALVLFVCVPAMDPYTNQFQGVI